jgi:hypothetical protein
MYVLMIGMIININSVLNVPTIVQEFTSFERCEEARVRTLKQFGHLKPMINQCVPK